MSGSISYTLLVLSAVMKRFGDLFILFTSLESCFWKGDFWSEYSKFEIREPRSLSNSVSSLTCSQLPGVLKPHFGFLFLSGSGGLRKSLHRHRAL